MKRYPKVDFNDPSWTHEKREQLDNILGACGIGLKNYSIPPLAIFDIEYTVNLFTVSVGDKIFMLDAFFIVSDTWTEAETGQDQFTIILH